MRARRRARTRIAARVLGLALAALTALVIGLPAASAQVTLVASSPGRGAIVTTPFEEVVLRFDRAVARVGVRATLDDAPLVVPVPRRGRDVFEAVIPVAGLPNGRYVIVFEATADDGSVTRGELGFALRVPPPTIPPVSTTSADAAAAATASPATTTTTSATSATTPPTASPAATSAPVPASTNAIVTVPTTTRQSRRSPGTSTTTAPDTVPDAIVPDTVSGTIAFPPTSVGRRRTSSTSTTQAPETSRAARATRTTFAEPVPVPLDLRPPQSAGPSTTNRLTLGSEAATSATTSPASSAPGGATAVATSPTSPTSAVNGSATSTSGSIASKRGTAADVTKRSRPGNGAAARHPGDLTSRQQRIAVTSALALWALAAIAVIAAIATLRRRSQVARILRGFHWATIVSAALLAGTALGRLRVRGAHPARARVLAVVGGAAAMLLLVLLRLLRGGRDVDQVLDGRAPDARWERRRAVRLHRARGAPDLRRRHLDVVTRRLRALTAVEIAVAALAIAVLTLLATR